MPLHYERKPLPPELAEDFRLMREHPDEVEPDNFLYLAVDPESGRPITRLDPDRLDSYKTVMEALAEMEPGWSWPKLGIGWRPPRTPAASRLFFEARRVYDEGDWNCDERMPGGRRLVWYEPIRMMIAELRSPYSIWEGPNGPVDKDVRIKELEAEARRRGEPL